MEPKQRTFSVWYAVVAMLALFAVQALLLVPRPEDFLVEQAAPDA
jgi:hypothetical protein